MKMTAQQIKSVIDYLVREYDASTKDAETAIALVAAGDKVTERPDGNYEVVGSAGAIYVVRPDANDEAPHCVCVRNCMGKRGRDGWISRSEAGPCKHSLAVAIELKLAKKVLA